MQYAVELPVIITVNLIAVLAVVLVSACGKPHNYSNRAHCLSPVASLRSAIG